jgi:hypothetical protein
MRNRFAVALAAALVFAAAAGAGARADGVGPSATGGGKFHYAPCCEFAFTFSAITHDDGTVGGEGHFDIGYVEPLHIDVNCLRVVGNVATFSGIVKNEKSPNFGSTFIFAVQDNGEGSNDPPDLVLGAELSPLGLVDCTTFVANAPPFELSEGNVQVHT